MSLVTAVQSLGLASSTQHQLINHQLEILQHHFPQLHLNVVVQQTNLIAAGLGVLVQQQWEQYEEVALEKKKVKNTTAEK